jgi:hypothetical protein
MAMTSASWIAIGSIAGCVGVIVAIGAIIVESRRALFMKGIEIVMQMDARFETPEFRQLRRIAARHLLDGRPAHDAEGAQALADVLNFFETLAFLHRRNAVSIDMIWHTFGTWILTYIKAADEYLKRRQAKDPNCFRDACHLFEAVWAQEEKEGNFRGDQSVIGKDNLAHVLTLEASLEHRVGAS